MENETAQPLSPFAEFNRRTFLGIILTGAVSALITVGAALLLNRFVIAPALCSGASETCASSIPVSFHIASLIAAIVAVAMLVNLAVYRPLLVMIAVLIGSWGMYTLSFPLVNLPWLWQIGIIFLVNSLSVLVFAWVLRAYNLAAGLILTLLIAGAMVAIIYL